MSAATADRLLRSQRKGGQRGLCTTRAGTLLKQQILIRTFQDWNETAQAFWKQTWWSTVAQTLRADTCTP
jgi:hypothetical protein